MAAKNGGKYQRNRLEPVQRFSITKDALPASNEVH
jgi:hypothetical protein